MAPIALASDFLKLPPQKKPRVKQHAYARETRVKFTDVAIAKYRNHIDGTKILYDVFVKLASGMHMLYQKERGSGSADADNQYIQTLDRTLHEALVAVQRCWPSEFSIPNVVATRHLAKSTRRYNCIIA